MTFAADFNMGFADALAAMGETVLLNGNEIAAVISVNVLERKRAGLGGGMDVIDASLIVSAADYAAAVAGVTGKDGAVVEFMGVKGRVLSTVPAACDRLELTIGPIHPSGALG